MQLYLPCFILHVALPYRCFGRFLRSSRTCFSATHAVHTVSLAVLPPMNALSLEPLIRRYFEAWGPMAYRFKWILFVLPLGLTIGLSFGLSRMGALRVDDPAYVFTPHDARFSTFSDLLLYFSEGSSSINTYRWRRELNFFSKNWPLNENKFLPGRSFEIKRFVNVLIHAHDGGTILRDELLKEIQVLNDWISNNISVPTDDGRFNLTFQVSLFSGKGMA